MLSTQGLGPGQMDKLGQGIIRSDNVSSIASTTEDGVPVTTVEGLGTKAAVAVEEEDEL